MLFPCEPLRPWKPRVIQVRKNQGINATRHIEAETKNTIKSGKVIAACVMPDEDDVFR
jgi:hypothetical protein